MQTSTQILTELKEAESRLASLKEREKELEQEMAAAKAEIRELIGGTFSRHDTGKIGKLQNQHATAIKYEADQQFPSVRVISSGEPLDQVVFKVTEKRIYTRRWEKYQWDSLGYVASETQWGIDGKSISNWSADHIHPDDLHLALALQKKLKAKKT